MAEASYYTKQHQPQINQPNPSKFFAHFLYKSLIVSIFLVILTHFPSQAPEFINQTLNTRGWEFLHLLFVGIAVSYGLFSRPNNEPKKQNKSNYNNYSSNYNNYSSFDNAQSFISRFLQVSSIFGDEENSPIGSPSDWERFQTWNHQCLRYEPVVVVAKESHAIEKEHIKTSSTEAEKPLLLPVRRLKSQSLELDTSEMIITGSNSNSGSKRLLSDSGWSSGSEFEGLMSRKQEDNIKENVVLSSPIPWRSRSGRTETNEVEGFSGSIRPQFSRSSTQPNSTNSSSKLSPSHSFSSLKKISPTGSFSLETQDKSTVDLVRKMSFHKSSPPPPPMIRKGSSMKVSYKERTNNDNDDDDDGVCIDKDLKRSLTNGSKNLNIGARLPVPSSVRTIRNKDLSASAKSEEVRLGGTGDGGQDVDKKADEFIAKFREQIMLQRIDSIER